MNSALEEQTIQAQEVVAIDDKSNNDINRFIPLSHSVCRTVPWLRTGPYPC